jgi:FtsP/CotA-like multicopper oxidase with cupredoxin domain
VSRAEAATLSRRRFLEGVAAAAASAGARSRGWAASRGDAALEIALGVAPGKARLDPRAGREASVLRFAGKVVSGRADALVPGESYLGPTFRVRRGERVRVRFDNGLDEPSIVHWHGLDVPEQADGHPRLAVAGGQGYRYDFTVENRPGLYWYHPHPDRRTGPQTYAGMAGLFLVTDPDDRARGLPGDENDLALVLQDRLLDADGELVYDPNPMVGFLGDRILVNGRPEASFTVTAGSYRLRLLNGSNARIYKLAFSDGAPLTVIGSDGGLLAAPVRKPFVTLGPGERVELWVDFAKPAGGGEVWLESQVFAEGGGMMGMSRGGGMGGMGMMGGGRGGARLPNGARFRVCRFDVRGTGRRLRVPARFDALAFRPDDAVENLGRPRRFDISMGMMRWTLNGATFARTEVAENERIKQGATEDWEFRNLGGMMTMAHPIHIHGGQFQVVERAPIPGGVASGEALRAGLVDEGWKDTFLVLPGERVRVRVLFDHHAGLFVYHCHNLEHEDGGMMRNFRVEA